MNHSLQNEKSTVSLYSISRMVYIMYTGKVAVDNSHRGLSPKFLVHNLLPGIEISSEFQSPALRHAGKTCPIVCVPAHAVTYNRTKTMHLCL